MKKALHLYQAYQACAFQMNILLLVYYHQCSTSMLPSHNQTTKQ